MVNCTTKGNDVLLSDGSATLRIRFYSENTARITKTKRSEFKDCDYGITVADKTLEPHVDCYGNTYKATAGGITVMVDGESLALSFYNKDGTILLRDPDGAESELFEIDVYKYIPGERPASAAAGGVSSGVSSVTSSGADAVAVIENSIDGPRARSGNAALSFDRKAYRAVLPLGLTEDEAVFGLGSHEDGYGNLRGKKRYLYQNNMKAVVPVIISNAGWGMLFNCGCAMTYDDTGEYAGYAAIDFDCVEELDYYFMGGGYDSVMREYRSLTGAAPLLPRWAFGYMQSKEHYQSADELIGIVSEYRRRRIPLDCIVQDWKSWSGNWWGDKNFDPARYPDPDGMMETLHKLGAHLMLSIWPNMTGGGPNEKEMKAAGFMLGNGINYNPFLPEARAMYWRQAYDGIFKHGVDAWWCDCTEPFEADWHGEKKPSEEDRFDITTGEAKKYLPRDMISLYSLYHSSAIYEGQRACSDKRVVNLTRSSWAGQHRNATITWSGDIAAKWETLRRQIPEGVNFAITGEPYWTVDIGAFFVVKRGPWFWDGDFEGGCDNNGYRELYTRWMQYGAFLPVMRSHGTDTPREIWRFGNDGEMFYEALRKYIYLRMSLVPYIYSIASNITLRGGSFMRPLALAYPKDAACAGVTEQYMFGDIMVCPVCRPMYYDEKGEAIKDSSKHTDVYLPEGVWYDFNTGERHTGGKTISVYAPIDVMPLFVPAGAIIATTKPAQYDGEIAVPPVTITVYPGADGEFTLYNDAGDGYGYEKGEYAETPIKWDDTERKLTIGERSGSYPGMANDVPFTVKTAVGDEVSFTYTGDSKVIYF